MPDHVDVIGTGSASGTPDAVVIDARVQCEARSVSAALSEVASRTEVALDAAADHGVADSDRRTTGIGIDTRWDHQGGGIVGYSAHHTLRLTVRERDRAGAVLHALAGAAGDALMVDAVSLELTDPDPLLDRARAAAYADAQHRATQYAGLARRDLGPVLRVSEVAPQQGPTPRLFAAARAADSGTMPLEPGESTLTASVRVRFALGHVVGEAG